MSTRTDLLVTAELLLRTKGYAAFSYADLADEIGIKKASIHHHFPTKEHLGAAVIESYLFRFKKKLTLINEDSADVLARLKNFSEFFIDSSNSGALPLCGALAAELSVLPEALKQLTRQFFEVHLAWLKNNLALGQSLNVIKAELDPEALARALLSVLEGGSFVAWALSEKVTDLVGFNLILNSSVVTGRT